jgi:hypothetical protein
MEEGKKVLAQINKESMSFLTTFLACSTPQEFSNVLQWWIGGIDCIEYYHDAHHKVAASRSS